MATFAQNITFQVTPVFSCSATIPESQTVLYKSSNWREKQGDISCSHEIIDDGIVRSKALVSVCGGLTDPNVNDRNVSIHGKIQPVYETGECIQENHGNKYQQDKTVPCKDKTIKHNLKTDNKSNKAKARHHEVDAKEPNVDRQSTTKPQHHSGGKNNNNNVRNIRGDTNNINRQNNNGKSDKRKTPPIEHHRKHSPKTKSKDISHIDTDTVSGRRRRIRDRTNKDQGGQSENITESSENTTDHPNVEVFSTENILCLFRGTASAVTNIEFDSMGYSEYMCYQNTDVHDFVEICAGLEGQTDVNDHICPSKSTPNCLSSQNATVTACKYRCTNGDVLCSTCRTTNIALTGSTDYSNIHTGEQGINHTKQCQDTLETQYASPLHNHMYPEGAVPRNYASRLHNNEAMSFITLSGKGSGDNVSRASSCCAGVCTSPDNGRDKAWPLSSFPCLKYSVRLVRILVWQFEVSPDKPTQPVDITSRSLDSPHLDSDGCRLNTEANKRTTSNLRSEIINGTHNENLGRSVTGHDGNVNIGDSNTCIDVGSKEKNGVIFSELDNSKQQLLDGQSGTSDVDVRHVQISNSNIVPKVYNQNITEYLITTDKCQYVMEKRDNENVIFENVLDQKRNVKNETDSENSYLCNCKAKKTKCSVHDLTCLSKRSLKHNEKNTLDGSVGNKLGRTELHCSNHVSKALPTERDEQGKLHVSSQIDGTIVSSQLLSCDADLRTLPCEPVDDCSTYVMETSVNDDDIRRLSCEDEHVVIEPCVTSQTEDCDVYGSSAVHGHVSHIKSTCDERSHTTRCVAGESLHLPNTTTTLTTSTDLKETDIKCELIAGDSAKTKPCITPCIGLEVCTVNVTGGGDKHPSAPEPIYTGDLNNQGEGSRRRMGNNPSDEAGGDPDGDTVSSGSSMAAFEDALEDFEATNTDRANKDSDTDTPQLPDTTGLNSLTDENVISQAQDIPQPNELPLTNNTSADTNMPSLSNESVGLIGTDNVSSVPVETTDENIDNKSVNMSPAETSPMTQNLTEILKNDVAESITSEVIDSSDLDKSGDQTHKPIQSTKSEAIIDNVDNLTDNEPVFQQVNSSEGTPSETLDVSVETKPDNSHLIDTTLSTVESQSELDITDGETVNPSMNAGNPNITSEQIPVPPSEELKDADTIPESNQNGSGINLIETQKDNYEKTVKSASEDIPIISESLNISDKSDNNEQDAVSTYENNNEEVDNTVTEDNDNDIAVNVIAPIRPDEENQDISILCTDDQSVDENIINVTLESLQSTVSDSVLPNAQMCHTSDTLNTDACNVINHNDRGDVNDVKCVKAASANAQLNDEKPTCKQQNDGVSTYLMAESIVSPACETNEITVTECEISQPLENKECIEDTTDNLDNTEKTKEQSENLMQSEETHDQTPANTEAHKNSDTDTHQRSDATCLNSLTDENIISQAQDISQSDELTLTNNTLADTNMPSLSNESVGLTDTDNVSSLTIDSTENKSVSMSPAETLPMTKTEIKNDVSESITYEVTDSSALDISDQTLIEDTTYNLENTEKTKDQSENSMQSAESHDQTTADVGANVSGKVPSHSGDNMPPSGAVINEEDNSECQREKVATDCLVDHLLLATNTEQANDQQKIAVSATDGVACSTDQQEDGHTSDIIRALLPGIQNTSHCLDTVIEQGTVSADPTQIGTSLEIQHRLMRRDAQQITTKHL